MVRLPKGTWQRKSCKPNKLNQDGTITVNGTTFKEGDTFTFACVATSKNWAKMFRNAKIESITADSMVTVKGTSDWKPAEGTFPLANFI